MAIAEIFGSTVLITLSKHIDIKWIFIGMGSFSIIIGLLLIFGIKDVVVSE